MSSPLLAPWQQPTRRRYVLSRANVIDVLKGEVVRSATVHLFDGKIVSVNGNKAEWEHDVHAVKLDLAGKYILPGLIDCHVHLAAVPGEKDLKSMTSLHPTALVLRQPHVTRTMLDRGFTSVRDCGGADASMREAIEQGVYPGPRLFISGHALSQTAGHGDMRAQNNPEICCGGAVSSISRIVDGVPECLKYTREELRQGADFIKIMSGGGVASPTDAIEHLQFSDDEVKAIVTVASNAGTYVTSHAYTPHAIQQAVKQGVKGIEHGNLIDEPTAKLMADKGVFLTPTLVTYATMEKHDYLPPVSAKKNREVLDKGLQAIKIAADAGVTVCFGTDLLGPLHYNQSHEFGIRAQVQKPIEVIRSATVNAAKLLRRENFLGQIAPGFAADLLILTGNPLEDINLLDDPTKSLLAVIKDGRVVSSRWSELQVEKQRLAKLA
ncbi:hypothetical protein DV735_g3943, partial [Chaetothyriales sp. CBS 134920]